MAEADIRTAIKAVLNTVADIGQVHDYERWTADEAAYNAAFVSSGQVRTWLVRRKGPVTEDIGGVATHAYIIDGFMAVDDSAATEKTFNALVEAVRAAFRQDATLSGACVGADFLTVNAIDVRMLGSVMCHHAELALTAYEEV